MTEKLTNQQREYEAQQMHRQHLQVWNFKLLIENKRRRKYIDYYIRPNGR